MYCLYIDTHFKSLVLVLFKNDLIVSKIEIDSGKHSQYMIDSLKKILEENKITVNEIDSIIVINGPGSFTGVRIGIVVAKIIGFTKKVHVKVLSYLEALVLNYDSDVNLGFRDKNGVFIGEFDGNKKLKKDYYYLNNEEFLKYNKDIVLDEEVDFYKVYAYMKDKNSINIHELKPLYVKKIEVEQ